MIKIIKLGVNEKPKILELNSKNVYSQLCDIVHGIEYNYPISKEFNLSKIFVMVSDDFGYNLTPKKLKKYYNKNASILTGHSEYSTCLVFKVTNDYSMAGKDNEYISLSDKDIQIIMEVLNDK